MAAKDVKISIEHLLNAGEVGVITTHAETVDQLPPDQTQLDDLVVRLSGWASLTYAPVLSNTVTVSRICVQQVLVPPPDATCGSPEVVGSRPTTRPGANEDAVVISLGTNRPGRSGRGRMFIPRAAPSTGDWDDTTQAFQSGYINALLTAFGQSFADEIAGPLDVFRWTVFSRILGTPAIVRNVRVGNRMDTQRRRGPRETIYSRADVVQ